MTQYDKIAKEYAEDTERRLSRRFIYNPRFLEFVGDVRGKDILDLACGSGHFTRKLRQKGARKVIGVDLSKEMIRIARQEEARKRLGIDYRLGDVANLGKIREFDIVTAGFLLHYSKTKQELESMCKNIYCNLKKRGRFVTLNQNPDSPCSTHKEYGSTSQLVGELKEGGKVKVSLWNDGREQCHFYNYHWKKSTYEQALSNAGFRDIKWQDLKVKQEGIDRFGQEFWKGWYESPSVICLEATKP